MKKHIPGTLALTFLLLQSASAHRAWVLPSTTVLSGEDQWVTVDAAVSNNLFFPNHHAPSLEQLSVTGPDGNKVSIQNGQVGEIRTTFDFPLTQEGTYRIDSGREGFMAIWMEGEQRKRWFGTAEEFKAQKIKEKPEVRLSLSSSPVVSYVTLGEPSTKVLAPTGKNLEVIFDETHPNDLFSGEEATFTIHLDGKPTAGMEVTIVKGQDRYRNDAGETKLQVGADGEVSYTWPEAGRYWVQIAPKREARTAEKPQAKAEQPKTESPSVDGVPYQKRVSFTATFEVLPE
ncbi:DUF4198 domain-containing protein [Verrucomicrobiaceae bacterium 227]